MELPPNVVAAPASAPVRHNNAADGGQTERRYDNARDPLKEREVICKEREVELKARELALREREQHYSKWLNPLFLGLVAATITLIGNLFVTERQARSSLQQEHLREQSNLILEAIKTGDTERAATNLSFFVKLGFIDDPAGNIKAFLANNKTQIPVLPSPSLLRAMVDQNSKGIIQQILDVVGYSKQIDVLESAALPNVAAATIREGKPVLVVNPRFINGLNASASSNWAQVFVLAHEIAHVILGHLNVPQQNRQVEIELAADKFAGRVCSKLGATLGETIAVFSQLPEQSAGYPARIERMKAASEGWRDGANPR